MEMNLVPLISSFVDSYMLKMVSSVTWTLVPCGSVNSTETEFDAVGGMKMKPTNLIAAKERMRATNKPVTTSTTTDTPSVTPGTTYGQNDGPKTEEFVWGDANCDGGVDMSDVVLVMQSLANPDKYGLTGTDKNHITLDGLERGAVTTGNKSVTTNDALEIQLFLLGKRTNLDPSAGK